MILVTIDQSIYLSGKTYIASGSFLNTKTRISTPNFKTSSDLNVK